MTTKPLDVAALVAEKKREYQSKLYAFEDAGTWEDLEKQYTMFKNEIFFKIKHQLETLPKETVESHQKNLLRFLNEVYRTVTSCKDRKEEDKYFYTDQTEQLKHAQMRLNSLEPEKLVCKNEEATLLDHQHLKEVLATEGINMNHLNNWLSLIDEIKVNQLLQNQKIYLKGPKEILPFCLFCTPIAIKVECLALDLENDSALASIVNEVVDNKKISATFEPSSVANHSKLCFSLERSKSDEFTVSQVLKHAKDSWKLIGTSIQDIKEDLDFKVEMFKLVRDAFKEWDSVR